MLDPEQLERYEVYRRSRIHPEAIKQVIKDFFAEVAADQAGEDEDDVDGNRSRSSSSSSSSGFGITARHGDENMVIMLQGLAKLYVGNLVETARHLMVTRGEGSSGPIMPHHLREASTRLRTAEANGGASAAGAAGLFGGSAGAMSSADGGQVLAMAKVESGRGASLSRAPALTSGVPRFTPGDESII